MEYRPFPDERVDEFGAFMRYAFSPAEGPYDPEEADDHDTVAERRGLFDAADEPVAVCAHHFFALRIRGADREAAGLSAVASPPEHRRQGYVGRVLRESLAEYRDRDVGVSVLWPFEYPFYAGYGWATASRYRRLAAPPAQLGFVDDLVATDGDAAGTFRPLDEDDYAAVRPLLAAMADRYDLTMDWTEEWWRERALRGWKTDPFVYGWERDGDLRALCRYTFDDDPDDGDETVMRVSDVAVADEEAWFQLLRFCRNHDSQVGEVRIRAPPDAPLLDLVDDPRAVDCEIETGPMARLVDVAAALEALDPDPATAATFALAVDDPLAAWNDAVVRVVVAEGTVAVERLDADSAGGDLAGGDAADADAVVGADATVDVGTLSQLYVGYLSVDEAVRAGGLAAEGGATPDDVTAALRALFPPRTTHLREGF
ncbi:MAG: GNAT family N-acetyltransferase [Halorubrum sp.]|uniref:GNAT family N-acetyltransferase n=1 Tax=Halorubrum sp. TaxID=1879286 RepID=UPI0039704FA1